MSSQRGNVLRSRSQKYKNTSKFKNNLHDKSQLTKKVNETVVSDCCDRCTEIIQWKINFKKYKLLGQPKKCVICMEKKVTNSYHVICSACGLQDSLCRKCKVKMVLPVKIESGGGESGKNEIEKGSIEENTTITNNLNKNQGDNKDHSDDDNTDGDRSDEDIFYDYDSHPNHDKIYDDNDPIDDITKIDDNDPIDDVTNFDDNDPNVHITHDYDPINPNDDI